MATKKRPARPKREMKADRLLGHQASVQEIQCDYALAPFDRMARAMELKWGIGVLEELVSPETAMKFGSAMAKMNEAINSGDPEMTAARAAVCIRGLEAMDREATGSGAAPASDDVWIVEADGHQFGLMRDARAWQRVQDKHPNIELVSNREMVLALLQYRGSVAREALEIARKSFPDAEITAINTKAGRDDLNDQIPW